MKLYKIIRTDRVWYDQFVGFVVRAESEERALEMCREAEYGQPRFFKENVEITELSADGEEVILLDSFNAG